MSLIKITHITCDYVVSEGYLTNNILESLRRMGFYRVNDARNQFYAVRKVGLFDYNFDITSLLVGLTHCKKDIIKRLKSTGDAVEINTLSDKWILEMCEEFQIEAAIVDRQDFIINGGLIENNAI